MNIKFYFQSYKKGKYYSQKSHSYYTSTDIGNQVWLSPTELCHGEQLDLYEIKRRINPNVPKTERNIIQRFNNTTQFTLKENVPYSKWNGIIFADLDLGHSKTFLLKIDAVKDNDGKIVSYNKEKNNTFYEALYEILSNIIPNNFYMIEHSSSGIGVHIMFYYDVEKTEENFIKCAEFSKRILLDKISNNEYGIIEDFNIIIREYEGVQKVLDPIIERAYQKCYITGIDWHINEFINGDITIDELDKIEIKKRVKDISSYDIVSFNINSNKKWLTDHNERFFLYTALKKSTRSEAELNTYWYEICKHFELYKDYTYKKFCNEFNYNGIKAEEGRIEILKKYGIEVDKSKNHIDLGNGYLGDKRDMILKLIQIGITLLKAPTGSGKTKIWTDLNKELMNEIMNMQMPILIVEPLNSIINTKYDSDVITITGSKCFPKNLIGYGMYVTNYNKLLKKGYGDTWSMREDIDEFLSQFGLIVLDESHILIKDSFRCGVLIPFIESINKAASKCKIVLQTATPMNEDKIFNIDNWIICHKENTIKTKWIYRRCINDKFNISDITCLVNYYVHNGRKVYVYWNNASLSQLNAFKSTYIDSNKVAIYHKRNTGEESMNRINKYHKLSYNGNEDCYEYDVLLSSVYFGVGNDLDDEQDAAVIIIGNNTWQEDIQAVGRWRNSKDVEICQIILPNEYEFINNTATEEYLLGKLISEQRSRLEKLWKDKLNKDKSVIINHKAYQITKESDIEILSIMAASDLYYSQFIVKVNSLSDDYYGYRIKPDYNKELECNADFTDANKKYWEDVKEIRDQNKMNIVNGIIDYDVINRDTKLIKFKSLWDRLHRLEIDKILGAKYIAKSTHWDMLNCWYDYYIALKNRNIDYPELYALLWFRDKYNKSMDDNQIEVGNLTITEKEYYMFLAYIIFVHNKNKDSKDYNLFLNYAIPFKRNCELFLGIQEELIDMLYKTKAQSEIDISQTKEFFGDTWIDVEFEDTIIHSINDIVSQVQHINKEFSAIQKVFKLFFNNCSIGGKKRSPKKKVTITEEFKNKEKYNLLTGQEFESATDLAIYANVSNKCVTQWISKQWVNKTK